VYGKLSGASFNEHCKNTVLKYPICNDKFKFHTTQKPLEMFSYLVRVSSNENDLILDCFSGSGTTAIACHNLNRRFICIEKDEDYYKASVERLENAKAQLKLF
jgi:DNA modification methylase